MGKMIRKALCATLSCVLLAGLLPVAALGAASTPFYDVAGDAWYATAVNYVYSTQLMSGMEERSFGPNVEATRGQIVTILYRLAGQPAVSGRAPFTDVAADSYCNSSVAWANAVGIASGTGGGKFQPSGAVTREQMATIFYRYACYKKYNVSKTTDLSVFDDQWQISSYAREPLSWAVGTGIMNGTDAKNISAHTIASRAVLATTLMRFCTQYNIKVPVVSAASSTVASAAAPAQTASTAPAQTVSTTPTQTASTTQAQTASATAAQTAAAASTLSEGTVSSITLDGSTVVTPKYSFQWPVQGRVSSDYGGRYIFGENSFHRGIDIPAPLGTGVHAGQGGTVTFAGEQGSYGNLVIIDHGNGFQSYYAHNTQILVNVGDLVQKNQVIAAVGSTGRSTGNHCHFEVHYKGQVVDPMAYLPSTNDAPANVIVVSAVAMAPDAVREAGENLFI